MPDERDVLDEDVAALTAAERGCFAILLRGVDPSPLRVTEFCPVEDARRDVAFTATAARVRGD